MVWILIADLNFQLQQLNFTAEFNILHSSFRIHIMGKCFYTFSFWIQLFYMTLFTVYFQLDKQIFIHCYFLLVLMPDEPALYIWQRCQFCIRYSLAPFRQTPHPNIVYFPLNFWIFVYASVIIGWDKRSLCGDGRRRPIDLLPRLFKLLSLSKYSVA